MAQGSRTEIVDIEINKIYETIIDYNQYPQYIEGVNAIKILEQNEAGAKIECALNIFKPFKYIINTKQEKPNRISWTLDSSDIFKKNDGEWKLKDLGSGKTEVTYSLDLDFKLLTPSSILSSVTDKNLPGI